jgi:hypothetical protein
MPYLMQPLIAPHVFTDCFKPLNFVISKPGRNKADTLFLPQFLQTPEKIVNRFLSLSGH